MLKKWQRDTEIIVLAIARITIIITLIIMAFHLKSEVYSMLRIYGSTDHRVLVTSKVATKNAKTSSMHSNRSFRVK